jgi:phage tail P2-like protein
MGALVTDTLLPPNATDYERALEGATARISDVPVLVRESWNPDECPPALLPWLADAFSVDTWEPSWSDAQKRQTIKDSVFVHRHKGTIGAVKRALAALGFDVQVQEWFNQVPLGAPYTFRLLLTADQIGYDQDAVSHVDDVVEATKNLRSHLSEIVPQVVTTAGPVMAGVAGIGMDMTVTYSGPSDLYLMTEGALNGMTPTEAAVDALHAQLNTTMPSLNYW